MRIWNTYGGLAAWRLRNMTHDEAPWRDQFRDRERDLDIPNESLKDFFQSRTQMG
jgi:uncharacterized phage-associated protein